MTQAQKDALKWLQERGGDAVRQGRGHGRQQVLAQGEIAPFMWSTFKALIQSGHVLAYGNYRLRIAEGSAA